MQKSLFNFIEETFFCAIFRNLEIIFTHQSGMKETEYH